MTNSLEVFNELEGHCLFEENTQKLFYDAMKKKNDLKFIKNSMIYVQENHTYVNRIRSIMSLL